MKLDVQIQFLNERIKTKNYPKYATEGSAGVDLYASLEEEINLEPGEIKIIPTGIKMHIKDSSVVGLIFARSGLSTKQGVGLANGVGVIDSDYTHEVKVALINNSKSKQNISPFDRIAQLVFMPIFHVNWILADQLDQTNRIGGFGSTGK